MKHQLGVINNTIEIFFYQGRTHKFRVLVHVDNWKQDQINMLLREINSAKQSCFPIKEGFSVWFFFLGRPDKDDRFLFHFDHPKCYTVKHIEKPKLPWNSHGVEYRDKINTELSVKKVEPFVQVSTITNHPSLNAEVKKPVEVSTPNKIILPAVEIPDIQIEQKNAGIKTSKKDESSLLKNIRNALGSFFIKKK